MRVEKCRSSQNGPLRDGGCDHPRTFCDVPAVPGLVPRYENAGCALAQPAFVAVSEERYPEWNVARAAPKYP